MSLLAALDAEPLPVSAGGIVFEDLSDLDVSPPVILIDDLLYQGGYLHLFSGHPGSGKTTIAMHMAKDLMAAGRDVVWLDFEMGPKHAKLKFVEVGITREAMASRLHYASWPGEIEKHLPAVAERWPDALVVIDSMSKALAYAGINENDNSEVTAWTTQVVKTCKNLDLCGVIVDHITKGGTESDYSRGAGAKLADVDVHWRVLAMEGYEFNRQKAGVLNLKLKKDRGGTFPFETFWAVGDGNGGLPITPMEGPPGDDPKDPSAPHI